MKVIISHDVDHITTWEHNKDLIIPKFIVRGFIELGLGYISTTEIMGRLKGIILNKWQNLEELMKFDRENNVSSTFFFGVSNGKGLKYSIEDSKFWIKETLQKGFDIGVHGIAFNNYDDIKDEYEIFRNLSGLERFGIRMHYLRCNIDTPGLLNKVGFFFDSSIYEKRNPYKVGSLWEFPLHTMDGYIFCKNNLWQNQNLKQSKETTKRIIEKAFEKDINYFTVLYHDDFFSDSFRTYKEWYIWVVRYLQDNKIKFVSYNEAIKELEGVNVQ